MCFYAMPFDRSVMDMPPEDYVGHLVRQFHPRMWYAAITIPLARRAEAHRLCWQRWSDALGFSTAVVPKNHAEGTGSQLYRHSRLAAPGDVARARALLGRPYLRQAAVAARRGGRWELFMTPNGKQDVPRETTGRCAPTGSIHGLCCCVWARGTRPVQPACGYDPA